MGEQNYDYITRPGRGDYRAGDTIRFTEQGCELAGEVIHVSGPGTLPSGRYEPTSYEVDAGDGFPHIVYASQILEP